MKLLLVIHDLEQQVIFELGYMSFPIQVIGNGREKSPGHLAAIIDVTAVAEK